MKEHHPNYTKSRLRAFFSWVIILCFPDRGLYIFRRAVDRALSWKVFRGKEVYFGLFHSSFLAAFSRRGFQKRGVLQNVE